MKINPNTTEENLLIIDCHRMFIYEPDTGLLVRKVASGNERIGMPVGSVHPDGYLMTTIAGKTYSVHRLIYGMVHLYFPDLLDHRDRNKLNNRIDNLRVATHSQNMFNRKLQVNSTTGVSGVYWDKSKQRYRASIKIDGRRKHIGYYTSFDEAVTARKQTEHKLFGEFVPIPDDITRSRNTSGLSDML